MAVKKAHRPKKDAEHPLRSVTRDPNPRLSFLLREALDELHQAPQRDSRRTLRDPRLLIFHPRRAGNVEMNPGSVFRELLQEHRRVNRAAPASTGVDNIRNARLD